MQQSTVLHPLHERLGARFTDFGGWEMPLQYEGVLSEHQAVRERVGVFDVSHLGRFSVRGPGAVEAMRAELCNDINRISPGRTQYTMALNPTGGVEDDIIVWWLSDEELWVLPNGVNFDEMVARFAVSGGRGGKNVEPVRATTALLAVQGPDAHELLREVFGKVPGRFRATEMEFKGTSCTAAGTGYTGERGAEIAVPIEIASDVFVALLTAGATPCGLGARDTLRLEMGYPLWGQDLDETTTPLEARLAWAVSWGHEFVGRTALVEQRENGLGRRLVGFRTDGRAIPRHGYPIRSGRSKGVVSSGNFSPTLGRGIGLGYLAPPAPTDVPIEVQIRGEWVIAEQVVPPFIER